MFHRVKSESDKPLSTQSTASEKQQDIEASIIEAEEQEETQMETTSEKKETPMTEQNDTVKEEPRQATTKPVDIPYAAPTAPRAAYPGTTSSAYGYGQATTTTEHNTEERRLVIGQGITMSGEIEHCDTLLVQGTIEAALKGAESLEVSETGTFYGTVEINEAYISGRFEGDLTVNGRLTVAAGGIITGSISYRELQIEAGAVIDGKLTPLKEGVAESKKPAPAKKEKSPKEAAALAKAREIKEQKQPANNEEGELFSATAAE